MRRNVEAAFTLLEIVLVIATIGVITLLAPLSVKSLEGIELKAAADRIVKDLRYARVKAIIDNKTYIFRIYRSDNTDKIDQGDDADYIIYCQEGGEEVLLNSGVYPAKFRLFRNLNPVRVEKEYYEWIRFTGNGTARGGTVGLQSSCGELIKIVVSSLGRVRIEKS